MRMLCNQSFPKSSDFRFNKIFNSFCKFSMIFLILSMMTASLKRINFGISVQSYNGILNKRVFHFIQHLELCCCVEKVQRFAISIFMTRISSKYALNHYLEYVGGWHWKMQLLWSLFHIWSFCVLQSFTISI